MRKSNIFNDVKMSIKLTGAFAFVFVFVTAMMLTGAKVRMDALKGLNAQYAQYVTDVKEIGKIKDNLGMIQENMYKYISIPSSRAKIQGSIKDEMAAIDNLVDNYKNKTLMPEKEKFCPISTVPGPNCNKVTRS